MTSDATGPRRDFLLISAAICALLLVFAITGLIAHDLVIITANFCQF